MVFCNAMRDGGVRKQENERGEEAEKKDEGIRTRGRKHLVVWKVEEKWQEKKVKLISKCRKE